MKYATIILIRLNSINYNRSIYSIYHLYTQHIYWANLVHKFKIVSLSQIFGTRLTQVCRIQWWCSLLLFLQSGNTLLGKLGPKKITIVSLNSNLAPTLIRICRIQWWYLPSSVFDWKYPFWAKLVQILKIISLSWNVVTRLIQICRIQWWYSLLPFSTGNILLGQICSQTSKLSA